MSVHMIQAIKFAPVSITQKLVLFALADCHNHATGRCDPSVAYLERVTGLSDRAIQKAVAKLEAAGILLLERRPGTSTRYKLGPNCTPDARDPRTSCSHDADSPANHVHPAPEPNSPLPRTAFALPPNDVPPNRNEPETNGKEPEAQALPRPVDWRTFAKEEAAKANAVSVPSSIPGRFRLAWQRWCDYRTGRAAECRTMRDSLPWTVPHAEATLRSCEHHASGLGWDAVIAGIDAAIMGNWNALHLDKNRTCPPAAPPRRDTGDLNSPDRYS